MIFGSEADGITLVDDSISGMIGIFLSVFPKSSLWTTPTPTKAQRMSESGAFYPSTPDMKMGMIP